MGHQRLIKYPAVRYLFITKKPLSVGEFTLVINKGDRISAGGKFPEDSYSGSDSNSI